jgi:amino-acid N-acetyltransferase
MVHGCGALHLCGDKQAEIAGLAVDRLYDHFGIGRRITEFLIERARTAGMERLFALTTQASDWFEQLGFRSGSVDDIPAERRERYDQKRQSRIVILDLV